MARFPLSLPPGVIRDGTEYQSKGRYAEAHLVRWYGSALGPVGGWRRRGAGAVSGKARAALAWTANDGKTWLGIGSHSKLFVMDRGSVLHDITPSEFSVGQADASGSGGYGGSTYNAGDYGRPPPDTTLIADATQWTLDSWGEYLLGVSPDDGRLYQWELDTDVAAALVTGAPDCVAVVTTAERFVFALGTDDPRSVSWCDQEDNTSWSPSATNQAGSFPLQTTGRLMCGCRVKGPRCCSPTWTFTWRSISAGHWFNGFQQVGDACGVISRQAVASFEQQAAWMSPNGFFLWNGGRWVG